MKQLFIKSGITILLLSVLSFHSFSADKYTLELKLEKGKTFKNSTNAVMSAEMDAMGQVMKFGVKSEAVHKFVVIGQTKDVYDMQMSLLKMKIDMDSPMMPFKFDSEATEIAGYDTKTIFGIPIDVQLSKTGKVVAIKGNEKLIEKTETISNEQIKQMLSSQFTEQVLKTSIEQSTKFFPDKPVEIGENWDIISSVFSNGVDIISKAKLSLKQVKDNVGTIELTGTLSTPEGGAIMKAQGMDMKVSIKGDQTGTILVDMKTGWIVSYELFQKYIQDVEVMGQNMKQKMDVKITVTAE